MAILTEKQQTQSLLLLQNFIDSGELVYRKDISMSRTAFQDLRRETIKKLEIYISDFLTGKMDIATFKRDIDSTNKRNNHWGFTAIKGQMFFNQLANVAQNETELIHELKDAIALPKDVFDAKQKINRFAEFVTKLGADAQDRRTVPNPNSIPYFLSYFWQVIDADNFPILYHSTDTVFKDLGFLPISFESMGDKYVYFYGLLQELRELFKRKTSREFSFWDIEHVFWFFYMKKDESSPKSAKESKKAKITGGSINAPKDEYIPPILQNLSMLANGDEELEKEYEEHGKKIEDVFEDKLHKLFVMLGYDTELLGKGRGRVPDGIARARQEQYAVIYDAKSRRDHYSIGTDSRAIIEYINTYTPILKREGIRSIYFAIISGNFKDNQDDAIKAIKMETGVQELLLLDAGLLLFILELKLKDSNVDLGKNGLQQVFQHTGKITKEEIVELLQGM